MCGAAASQSFDSESLQLREFAARAGPNNRSPVARAMALRLHAGVRRIDRASSGSQGALCGWSGRTDALLPMSLVSDAAWFRSAGPGTLARLPQLQEPRQDRPPAPPGPAGWPWDGLGYPTAASRRWQRPTLFHVKRSHHVSRETNDTACNATASDQAPTWRAPVLRPKVAACVP